MMALANLKEMCKSYLSHGYRVRIIDLRKEPNAAARDNILAVPTLKCVAPGPERTMVGSLSDVRVVSKWLALDAPSSEEGAHPGRRVVSVQPVGRA